MRKIIEGDIPFLGLKTHYRMVVGTDSSKRPLILLHGGPGSSHNSLEVLDPIADQGRTLVYYDQIG
ncbi:MAG TPA: alpha/beta hydrolase, partial [Firmicutes bacterium]|nr:alpha/beta hydrolase [Bacillota bacterium]